MDLTKIRLCRLCLQTNDNVVNIWETFHDSSIASILTKHFWFQVHKDNELTEFICNGCWLQTKTFHLFYEQIEQFQKCFYDSVAKDKIAEADAVEGVDSGVKVTEAIKTELNIIKCEEAELQPEAVDSQISTHSKYDGVSDESEPAQSLDNETECSKLRLRNDKEKSSPPTVKKRLRLSPSEKAELDGQIRDLFKMNCEFCSTVKFRTLSDAHEHYRNVHKRSGYLLCCGKRFTYIGQVLDHIRHHVDPKVNGPSEVEAEIREWFAMKCDICTETVEFQTLLEVQRHYRKVHSSRGYLRSTCCDVKLRSRSEMLNHIHWHTNSDKMQCGQCSKVFKNRFTLNSHIANHTPHDSRTFNCTLCTSRFALAASLRSHVKNKHTSKTGEKFNCDKCSKSFRSNLLLSHHIRYIHESTTEYVCEICARIFKSKTALQNHIDLIHSSNPPPKVQCDICGVWLRRLYDHRKCHERAIPVNCPICNKVLTSEKSLDAHVRYVHGDRSHKCQLCKKSFVNTKSLKEHVAAIHTGEYLYDCPYCEKKFKSNANMHHHRKNAHIAEWTRDLKPKIMRKTTTSSKQEPDANE